MGRRFWWAAAAVALLAVALPCLGAWARRHKLPRCALDGVAIEPIYAVEIVEKNQAKNRFCCLRCAEYWLAHEASPPAAVQVADEVSGRIVDADEAFFVRSSVVTNAVTGNRVHAFAERADAKAHAGQFKGRLLLGSERPLQAAP